jgi:hypothetical protein
VRPAHGRRELAVGRRLLNELLDTLRALGLPEEAIDRAIARGEPESAIFETVLLAQAAERTVTAAEIEKRGGPRLAELETFIEAFGLPWPGPEQPAFTPAEADVFVELERLRDVWPPEIALQVARVYGRLLARIAQTEVDSFRVYVELHRLARLAHDIPQVAELDLNPVIGLAQGCVAVDARVRLRRPQPAPRTKTW